MIRTARWPATLAVAALLSLGLLTPVATATAAPSRSTASAAHGQRDLVEVPARTAFEQAVSPTECDPNTLLRQYFNQQLAAMSDEQFDFLVDHQVVLFNVPTYDALFFGTAGDPDYALSSHARQIQNTFRDLKRFWSDVQTDDIQLMAMHGDALLDADRIADTLTAMVQFDVIPPMTPAEIDAEAHTVADFMTDPDQGDFFDNPLWTFNAFAFSGEGESDPALRALPDKLVMGDGILAAYDSFGLGDVGPRVIMAHEFAHHVQYELGVFDAGPADPAEATRRTELMADAMAAYFGVHKKGLALNKKRVVDALLSFSAVGDCEFADPGHHGTPLQRQRAAAWGADLAAAARPQSFVLPAAEVVSRFEAALPGIVSGS